MKKAQFRFSANIIKRLGEELNPSPDQSILELVKNSYDADARSCSVELINIDKKGGTILIEDDGDGMDAQTIVDGWLVLGRSIKSTTRLTRLGRTPAGNKGLGRLAALRLGNIVTLTTVSRKSPKFQSSLKINWSDFDNVDLVDEVNLEIIEKNNIDEKPGTKILLEDLHTTLNRSEVQKIARSLIMLADPFGADPHGFKPILKTTEFTDLEKLVTNRYFIDAEYHLIANVDKHGRSSAKVVDFLGNELFKATHKEIALSENLYLCPPTEFDLWAFILDSQTFSTRNSTIKEVKEWLHTFGGVHLYENGLRVTPYGNPGNDWLEMNLARVKSPEERPSTNNSIGKVSVKNSSGLLIQKTDRSGYIESEPFLEIERFAKDALQWMARKRLDQATKRRNKERSESPTLSEKAKEQLKVTIGNIPGKTKKKLKFAFEKYDKAREKEIKSLRNEVQLYRTLSTAGITAGTFAHESAGNPLKVITQAIKTIVRRGREYLGDKYDSTIGNPINLIIKSTDALKVLSKVTLNLLDHEKRRASRINLHSSIKKVVEMFKPFLDERVIQVEFDFYNGNPFLRGSEAAIEAIFTNLINNSVVWLEKINSKQRKIVIRTNVLNDFITIRLLDNGVGINEIDIKDIWLPGQTTRPNGTGLGLTIVNDTVKDLGGNVDAVEKGEFGGAEIIIELPILGD